MALFIPSNIVALKSAFSDLMSFFNNSVTYAISVLVLINFSLHYRS